ncbi:hypothetical protein FLM48_19770 [Shewanella sp. Scap07]|uniref:hypothetical protein n=1 Tax=Shewanella sp. Scap07 TaxID=2589987 RepID=UPI0015BC8446|nr:hypothetical protein [Shewanella sp. Scap07]QLE87115.1 hypothetical protein FLM48_19770 [Shewanella sp. Scap07]
MQYLCNCLFKTVFGCSVLLSTMGSAAGNSPVVSTYTSVVAGSHVWLGSGWNNWDYGDRWRWGIGVGSGSPYWNSHRYYWNRPYWNRPYWNNRWRYPYRYERRVRDPEPATSVAITPPQRTTTSVEYSDAIHSLPANARVIQRDNRTIYEWQGIEYVYDWHQQQYVVID